MNITQKRIRIQDDRGFTLLELMVVVMVVAILASFAIPLFLRYRSQAMQSEARTLLDGAYKSEIAYYAEFSEFSIDPDVLNFNPITDPKFYRTWYVKNIDVDVFRDRWIITDNDKKPWNNWDDIEDMEDPYPYGP